MQEDLKMCSKCKIVQAHLYVGFYEKPSGKICKKYRDDRGRLWQNSQCNTCYSAYKRALHLSRNPGSISKGPVKNHSAWVSA